MNDSITAQYSAEQYQALITFQAMLLTGLNEMGLLSPAGLRSLTELPPLEEIHQTLELANG